MASVYKEISVDATSEQVWAAIRDVGSVHVRLIPQRVIDTQLEGNSRIRTFPDGGKVRELILDVNDEMRRLAYAVVEGRMPLVYHHATFQVFPDGESSTRLVWMTDFLPNEFAPTIRMTVDIGALEMKQALEDDARRS